MKIKCKRENIAVIAGRVHSYDVSPGARGGVHVSRIQRGEWQVYRYCLTLHPHRAGRDLKGQVVTVASEKAAFAEACRQVRRRAVFGCGR